MILASKSDTYKFLLTKKTVKPLTEKKLDIILSPEFYWVRIFSIPVKTNTQAIKLLPTLFEDILPEGDFNFQVKKLDENRFLAFAYDEKAIYEFIQKLNIERTQVVNFYFAQCELIEEEAFCVDENYFLFQDGILIKVPKSFVSNAQPLGSKLQTLGLSKFKANIKLFSSLIDVKYIKSLSILCILVFMINMVVLSSLFEQKETLSERLNSVQRQSVLPSSKIQATSIINGLKQNVSNNLKLRDALKYIAQYNRKQSFSVIENIRYKKDVLWVSFKNVDTKQLEAYLLRVYTLNKKEIKDNKMNVEIKL